MPTPSTFLVRLALFIFSSEPELELLELLPDELLPDDPELLLLDELELEFLFFLVTGARFLAGVFLTAFFFLSSEELVPDDELLLEESLFLFADFLAGFFTGFFVFLSDLVLDEELLDDFLREGAAAAFFVLLLDAGFDVLDEAEEDD